MARRPDLARLGFRRTSPRASGTRQITEDLSAAQSSAPPAKVGVDGLPSNAAERCQVVPIPLRHGGGRGEDVDGEDVPVARLLRHGQKDLCSGDELLGLFRTAEGFAQGLWLEGGGTEGAEASHVASFMTI